MTVETTTARVQYATNGTTGPWTVPFYFLEDDHITVIHTDEDGVETTLGGGAYSVTGAGDPNGGSVTTTASYAALGTITVLRSIEPLQETDLVDGDSLPAETLETALDKLTMLMQQALEVVARSLVFSPSDTAGSTLPPAAARASRLLGFDSDGVLSLNAPVDGTAAALALSLASSTTPEEGAGMIGYLPLGTGAVASTVHDVLRESVSVFGFIHPDEHAAILAGTSTFNAAPDIIEAITYALTRTPCRLVFPTGKYKCDAVLGSFTGSNLVIDFNGSILDFSAVSDASTGSLLLFTGTYGTGVALTSNAAADQSTVACVSAGMAVGDLVRVYSEDTFDPGRTDSRIGELNFIETIPGGASVTLSMPLQGTYNTADTAKIEVLTPIRNVVYRNGTFIGPAANDESRGWRFRLGIECVAENMRTFDIDYLHAQLTDCINSTVRGCYFEEAKHASTGYGLSFADASQDCLAIGNHFVKVRHSLSTNNNVSTSYGVTRRIRFEANIVRDSEPATGGTGGDAIDAHAGAEDIEIINNQVQGSSGVGINVESRTARVVGNRVKHTNSVGIYWHPFADQAGNAVISDNLLEAIGDGSGTDSGILVLPGGSVAPSRLTVTGNHVESTTSEAYRIQGLVGDSIRNITFSGNTGRTTAGTTAVRFSYAQNGVVVGNMVSGASAHGMLFEDCGLFSVGANVATISGTETSGYMYRFTGTGTRNNIIGALGANSGTYTNAYGVHFAGTITNSAVRCCNFGSATDAVELGAGAGNVETDNLP